MAYAQRGNAGIMHHWSHGLCGKDQSFKSFEMIGTLSEKA